MTFKFLQQLFQHPEHEASSIVPQIKHADFLVAITETKVRLPNSESFVSLSPDEIPVTHALDADLLIAYAFELPDRFDMVTPANLDDLDIKLESLRELAVENLLKRVDVVEPERRDGLNVVSVRDNLTSGLFIVERLWEGLSSELDGELIAAIPNRNVILYASGRDEAALDVLRRCAAEAFEWEPVHALSQHLFAWRDKRWVEYDRWSAQDFASPISPLNTNSNEKSVVVLTAAAAKEVQRIISKENLPDKTVLRVRVVPGPVEASGGRRGQVKHLTYDVEFDQFIDVGREWYSESFGVTVVVDKNSAIYLEGTTIDFEDSVDARGFRFHNPNAYEVELCLRGLEPNTNYGIATWFVCVHWLDEIQR